MDGTADSLPVRPPVEPRRGLSVASFQGWSSFTTGASKFASAAKEGVSSPSQRPACRPTQAGLVWGLGADRGLEGAPMRGGGRSQPQGSLPGRVLLALSLQQISGPRRSLLQWQASVCASEMSCVQRGAALEEGCAVLRCGML